MQLSPIAAARYFISKARETKCNSEPCGLDHIKLQKLIFITHGNLLVASDGKKTLSQSPERIKFGDNSSIIYPSLAREAYRRDKASRPVSINQNFEITQKRVANRRESRPATGIGEMEKKVLDSVWLAYADNKYTNTELTAFIVGFHPEVGRISDAELICHFNALINQSSDFGEELADLKAKNNARGILAAE